jgi:hypothetical protein
LIHNQKIPGNPNVNQDAKRDETRPRSSLKKGMDKAIIKAMIQRRSVILSQETVAVRVRVLMWWGRLAKIRLKMYLEATWPKITPAMIICRQSLAVGFIAERME